MPVNETVNIVITQKGARRVKRELADVRNETNALRDAFSFFRKALVLVGFIAVAREVIVLADSFNQLQNRLRIVTNSTEELQTATQQLFNVSQRTRTNFRTNAEVYTRLFLSTRQLNISQTELFKITETLNKALIVSGSTSQEANAGIIQLTQGLASGTLRGDELRSVLEQLPFVAEIIARQLGVTRGELRKLGEQGKISANEVVAAFQNFEDEVQEEFAKTVPTITQTFVQLGNSIVATFSNVDSVIGFTDVTISLVDSLRTVVDLFGSFNKSASAASLPLLVLSNTFNALTVAAGTFLALSLATQLLRIKQAIEAVSFALFALRYAVVTNPFTAGLAAVSAMTAGIYLLTTALKNTQQELIDTSEVIDKFSNSVADFEDISRRLRRARFTGDLETEASQASAAVISLRDQIDSLLKIQEAGIKNLSVFQTSRTGTQPLVETAKVFEEAIDGTLDNLNNELIKILGPEGDIFKELQDSFTIISNQVPVLNASVVEDEAFVNVSDAVNVLQDRLEQLKNVSQETNETYREEQALLKAREQAYQNSLGIIDRVKEKQEDLNKSILKAEEGASALFKNTVRRQLQSELDSAGVDVFTRAFRTSELELELAKLDEVEQKYKKVEAARVAEVEIQRESVRARESSIESLKDLADELRLENQLIGLSFEQREEATRQIELENLKTRALSGATAEQASQVRNLVNEIQSLIQAQEKLDPANKKFISQTFELQARLESLSDKTDLASGLERANLRLQLSFQDTASQIEDAMVSAFSSAEDAFVDFARTGKLSFSDLADSIIEDLLRIAVRQLVLAPISNLLGGVLGFSSSTFAFGGGRNSGGTVSPGRAYKVGETGPEMFVPTTRGTIVNNKEGSANQPIVINQSFDMRGASPGTFAQMQSFKKQIVNESVNAVYSAMNAGGNASKMAGRRQ